MRGNNVFRDILLATCQIILILSIIATFGMMLWIMKETGFNFLLILGWIIQSLFALGFAYVFEAVRRYLNTTD